MHMHRFCVPLGAVCWARTCSRSRGEGAGCSGVAPALSWWHPLPCALAYVNPCWCKEDVEALLFPPAVLGAGACLHFRHWDFSVPCFLLLGTLLCCVWGGRTRVALLGLTKSRWLKFLLCDVSPPPSSALSREPQSSEGAANPSLGAHP